MDSKQRRKEAIKEFKERKVPRGIFAVRCVTTGRVWVDSSPNLDAARNGAWFALRLGSHRNKELQAEWNAQGEQSFEFEILEKFKDDVVPLALHDLLKERKRHWEDQITGNPASL